MMDQFKVRRAQYAIMGRTGPVGFYETRDLVLLDADDYIVGEWRLVG